MVAHGIIGIAVKLPILLRCRPHFAAEYLPPQALRRLDISVA
jgi:hypothetical protein